MRTSCASRVKRTVARHKMAWSLGRKNTQKSDAAFLSAWIFGGKSHEGLKISTRSCNAGTLRKGQSRLSIAPGASSEGARGASLTALWR